MWAVWPTRAPATPLLYVEYVWIIQYIHIYESYIWQVVSGQLIPISDLIIDMGQLQEIITLRNKNVKITSTIPAACVLIAGVQLH